MAHQPTEKTRSQVESAAAIGIAQEDIARLLGITAKTLRGKYRKELDLGSVKANMTIGGALYKKAREGDTACMIWWSKAKMGWREEKQDTTPSNVADVLLELARRLPD